MLALGVIAVKAYERAVYAGAGGFIFPRSAGRQGGSLNFHVPALHPVLQADTQAAQRSRADHELSDIGGARPSHAPSSCVREARDPRDHVFAGSAGVRYCTLSVSGNAMPCRKEG